MIFRMGFTRSDWRLIIITVVSAVAAGTAHYAKLGGDVAPFVIAAVALALLASLVGRSVEALGDRLGAGATGVVQSALGNLPELFVVALRAARRAVRRGHRHHRRVHPGQRPARARPGASSSAASNTAGRVRQRGGPDDVALMALSVAALLVPSLTAALGTRDQRPGTSAACRSWSRSLLLGLFVLSLPASIKRTAGNPPPRKAQQTQESRRSRRSRPASGRSASRSRMLAIAGVGAAFVSDWFVTALQPAMATLRISEAFAGLVIVAIAGNAVENVVGIQLAARTSPTTRSQ